MFKTTMPTLKPFPIAIRLSFFGVEVMATRASLRSISGRNKDNRDACNSGFVIYKHPQLVKRPVVGSATFLLGAWLLVKRLPNVAQVLKRQCCTNLLRLSYQFLTDIVVDPLLEPSFSAREPSQELPTTPSAFARDVGSCLAVSITSLLQLLAIPRYPCRSGSNVAASQIDTNHLGCFTCWGSVKLNSDIDVETPVLTLNQGGTGGCLSRQQCPLVVANQQLECVALVNQCDSNLLGVRMIDKRPGIQADTGRTKLPNLLGGFQVAQHPTNRLTNVIRLKSSCLPYRFVGQVVQLGSVVALVQLSGYQNGIASLCKPLHCAVNRGPYIVRDLKLARYRQRLGHVSILLHPPRIAAHPAPLSSPPILCMDEVSSGKDR